MISRYIALLLLLSLTVAVSAQDFGFAIVHSPDATQFKYTDAYLAELKKKVDRKGGRDFKYFTWSLKDKGEPIPLTQIQTQDSIDRPITAVAYLNTSFRGFDKYTLDHKVDTSGKVTSVYFQLYHSAQPMYKVVNLATSEVTALVDIDDKDFDYKSTVAIKGFGKYFGKSTPARLKSSNPKRYKEVYDKLLKYYGPEIKKAQMKTVDAVARSLADATSKLLGLTDDHLWTLHPDNPAIDGKLKEFYITSGTQDRVHPGEYLSVYAKQKYGAKEVYDQLTLIGVDIKTVDQDKTLVKTNLFNRKKIKNAIEEGAELVFARNDDLVRLQNVKPSEYKRVQVKSSCFMCAVRLEESLNMVPAIKLIERGFDDVRDYFTAQYTDEKYMDFDMAKVQSASEGVQYIYEKTDAGLQATDVETGRIVRAEARAKKGLLGQMMFGGVTGADIINLSMDILGLKLELLEITKEKKGKAKKVRVYSPMGYAGVWKMRVVRMVEETVGSRTLMREEKIGWLSGRTEKTPSIKDFKVKEGGKEIYDAVQNGEQLTYILE